MDIGDPRSVESSMPWLLFIVVTFRAPSADCGRSRRQPSLIRHGVLHKLEAFMSAVAAGHLITLQ